MEIDRTIHIRVDVVPGAWKSFSCNKTAGIITSTETSFYAAKNVIAVYAGAASGSTAPMNGADVVEQVLGVRCRSRADIFENVFTQQTQVNTLILLYEVPLIKVLV